MVDNGERQQRSPVSTLPGQVEEEDTRNVVKVGSRDSRGSENSIARRLRGSLISQARLSEDGLLLDESQGLFSWFNDRSKEHARIFRDDAAPHPCPWARKLVKTQIFEFTLSSLIILNCIFIGFQANYSAPRVPVYMANGTLTGETVARESCGTPEELVLCVLEHFFTACFCADLILRVIACGWTFLFDRSNFIDIFLVVLSVLVTWVMVPLGLETAFLRKLTVLRTLRLVRLAKAVRNRQEFKEMWALLKGLVDSRETLIWTYVMIALLLYFFAIISTSLIGKQEPWIDDEWAQELFGDVPKSMLTLFQVMTLDSWSSLCRPLMKDGVWVALFFCVFISVAQFVLMNLITAVIVENAFSDAKADDKEAATKAASDKDRELTELKQLFRGIDADGSGTVSKEEIRASAQKRKVRQKLYALDIVAKDIEELWEILDDGDGELSADEFVNGLQRLRGEAKAKDVLRLYRELRILEGSVSNIEDHMSSSQEKMERVRKQLKRSSMDIAGMHRTILKARESIKHAALTQPLRSPR